MGLYSMEYLFLAMNSTNEDLQGCNLNGWFSYVIQILLIILIFVAVKSRLG